MGVGLVRSLQPWEILLIYCNKQFKKYIAPFLRLASGALSAPFWCLCQELSLSLFTVVKFLPHKSPEWSSLVSDLEAKSSSSDIMNLTLFTISYHMDSMDMSLSKLQKMVKDRSLACYSQWGCKSQTQLSDWTTTTDYDPWVMHVNSEVVICVA